MLNPFSNRRAERVGEPEEKRRGARARSGSGARERATAPSYAERSTPNGLLCNYSEPLKLGGRGRRRACTRSARAKGGAWRAGALNHRADPKRAGGARPKQYAENRAQKYAITIPERTTLKQQTPTARREHERTAIGRGQRIRYKNAIYHNGLL